MHIHLPKPLHGWRELLGEIGVIVVGVLIAIGFEQSVEAYHWHEQVAEAREAIHAELRESDAHYAFVIATGACVDRRLALLDGIIEDVAAGRHVAPVGLVGMHIGDALDDSVWQSQRSAQTLVHFPKDEIHQLGMLYQVQGTMRGWVEKQEEAWADLRMLEGDPNRLKETDVTALRRALQSARRIESLEVGISAQLLARAASAGVPAARANREDVARTCRPLARTPSSAPFTVL